MSRVSAHVLPHSDAGTAGSAAAGGGLALEFALELAVVAAAPADGDALGAAVDADDATAPLVCCTAEPTTAL